MATLGILHSRLDRGFGRGIAVGMVGLLPLNEAAPATLGGSLVLAGAMP